MSCILLLWWACSVVVELFVEVSGDGVGGLGVSGDDVVVGVDDGDRVLLFYARELSDGLNITKY